VNYVLRPSPLQMNEDDPKWPTSYGKQMTVGGWVTHTRNVGTVYKHTLTLSYTSLSCYLLLQLIQVFINKLLRTEYAIGNTEWNLYTHHVTVLQILYTISSSHGRKHKCFHRNVSFITETYPTGLHIVWLYYRVYHLNRNPNYREIH
jgi:hypothetical protein